MERNHIPKSDLEDGQTYYGHCRNSNKATWRADKQRFEYLRTKFGHQFIEEICAPEDDKYFDVFYAQKKYVMDSTDKDSL